LQEAIAFFPQQLFKGLMGRKIFLWNNFRLAHLVYQGKDAGFLQREVELFVY
jgi:hypothetical protein